MGDQFSYGYLVRPCMPQLACTDRSLANKGFAVDEDGVIHYLTGSPLRRNYVRFHS